MSRTVQDTRTSKPPLFLWNNRGEESKHLTFFVLKFADEGSACNVGEFMSRTVQDTRTSKPPLFLWNNRGEESKYLSFFVLKFADEGTRTPMSFLART